MDTTVGGRNFELRATSPVWFVGPTLRKCETLQSCHSESTTEVSYLDSPPPLPISPPPVQSHQNTMTIQVESLLFPREPHPSRRVDRSMGKREKDRRRDSDTISILRDSRRSIDGGSSSGLESRRDSLASIVEDQKLNPSHLSGNISFTRQLAFGDVEEVKVRKWHVRRVQPFCLSFAAIFFVSACIGVIVYVRWKEKSIEKTISIGTASSSSAHEQIRMGPVLAPFGDPVFGVREEAATGSVIRTKDRRRNG